ncbi:MAG: amylo-alpha-1,6-glucosidase [Armatimonadota bacterium]
MNMSHEFKLQGWNTFDVRSLTSIVHFPSGLKLRIGLLSGQGDIYRNEFRWPELARLGAHTPDCSYATVTLQIPECRLNVEFASENDVLVARTVVTRNVHRLIPYVDLFFCCGHEGDIVPSVENILAIGGNNAFRVCCPAGMVDPQKALLGYARFIARSPNELIVVASPVNNDFDPNTASKFLECKREDAERWERRFDDSELQSAFEGMWRSVIWNTIYASSIGMPVTVVSRDWCVDGNYGEFVLFEWDTFFAALQSGAVSKELAYTNVRAVLSGVTEDGFVPSIFCELGKSADRSMLPVGSIVVLKLYERFRDLDFLSEVYPKLLRWHDWWFTARDGNADGLLEWGSDDVPPLHPQWQAHTLQAARYESGLDNGPLYDDAEFDPETNTMKMADVGLNAAYAMDSWALANIAEVLGDQNTASRLKEEHRRMARLINEKLWSDEHGIFLNRRWDSSFVERLAPTLFYPLVAKVVSHDRAERMVIDHLLNESEFWGRHIIPSISRNDPAYHEQAYWRGRIWGPMNWLVYEGLDAYGFSEVVREFGRRSLKTFLGEWLEESHVHENYNSETGEGDDTRYSEPVYFWGGLLALIGLLSSGAMRWKEN